MSIVVDQFLEHWRSPDSSQPLVPRGSDIPQVSISVRPPLWFRSDRRMRRECGTEALCPKRNPDVGAPADLDLNLSSRAWGVGRQPRAVALPMRSATPF